MLNVVKRNDGDMKRFCLNTGTMFDLATGKFLPGKNGWVLNGGLNITNALVGREQTFKSSIALGYFARALVNYIGATGICYDTEYSISDVERITSLAGNRLDDSGKKIDERITLYDKTDYDMDGIFTVIKDIAEEKKARHKEFIAETPFINPDTGKFFKSYTPTIVAIDSWTLMQSAKEISMFDKGLDDKGTNTSYMVDGNKKSQMMRQLPLICSEAGIYLILTAHVGDSIKMDPFAPIQKDLPNMRASDKIKGVGSQFNFLVSNLMETRSVSPVQVGETRDKECKYPLDGGSSGVELQEVGAIVCRCKNNMSGSYVRHIISQTSGIQEKLDYYHMLRESKSTTIEGTVNQKMALMPDTGFNRKNVRAMIRDNYEFGRAMEIIGQFVFIQNNWNIPEFKNMDVMTFCNALMHHEKPAISDVLNSTGVWTFRDVKASRKYMSILDVFEMVAKNTKK